MLHSYPNVYQLGHKLVSAEWYKSEIGSGEL